MKYATLGNTGLIVSRLSFGAMTFGSDPSVRAVYKVSDADAMKMVDRALGAGINFYDTADGYSGGQSEEMLGRALGGRRKDVVIATKVGFRTGEPVTQAGLSRRHILYSCEASLRRLNTDHIDLYIFHKEDPYTPLEESLEAMDQLVRAGKVRYAGFSNWPAWRAAAAWQMQRDRGWAVFSSGQMNYSLVGRDAEQDIIPFMEYAKVSMTVWGPLAGGFLSGKYTRENLTDKDNRLSGFDLLPFDKEFGFSVVEVMKGIAAAHKASVAQVALAWLLTKPAVASIILGASKIHQLEDNLGAVELQLHDDEIRQLDEMTRPRAMYPHWFNQQMADKQHKDLLG
jgi:aryl-alcohol dehydrogenase-like predicted oxidoreductase